MSFPRKRESVIPAKAGIPSGSITLLVKKAIKKFIFIRINNPDAKHRGILRIKKKYIN